MKKKAATITEDLIIEVSTPEEPPIKIDELLNLMVEKGRQGRISVDQYLRLNETCFVIGDCAQFPHKVNHLRMAVQFSIAQGLCAASNVLLHIKASNLKKYKPIDLGYIIPMANNCSCGKVMGFPIKGRLPTLLHYLMCIYRSFGFKNKVGMVKCLLKGGAS